MGNMTKDFVPGGKEEQAEIKDDTNAQKVAALLGIDCEWMITYFCKPKLKVGTGKNSLSNALGELEGRLSDAENIALKSGKTAMAKLEGKIRELEAELAGTQSRTGEATKAYQRAERKAKELAFAQGEDKKNQDRMSELASKLQMKIKTYKQQIV